MTLQEKIANAKPAEDLFRDLSPKEKKYEEIMAKIAIKIQQERLNMKMTQKEFADYMHVKQSMVSKWESGDANFSIKNAIAIFDKLNIKFDICFPESYRFESPRTVWGDFADKRSKTSMINMSISA